jgi:REP element-mobilizing transposase RayT
MPRIPRSVFPDGLFHVAARGVAKMPIYHDTNDRRNFLSLLVVAVEHYEWTCHAFCLMTNHYHLVLDTTRENLSDGMQILNGDYAQGFNGKYGRWGHVFGDRFWCRSLDEEELEHVCRYVMENPVRAGLCKHSADWAWSAVRAPLRPARTRRTRR